jgi:methylmalonyl-CoA mutase N-terminal domain/subunit
MMNALGSSPGMRAIEQAVEDAIIDEFREIDHLGGVLAAIESRYQRSQIQSAAHRLERQISDGTRPIVGVNRYRNEANIPDVQTMRTPKSKKQLQIDRLEKFKRKHRKDSQQALDELSRVVESGDNVFAQLIETVEHCSLGQITARLHELVGHYRPTV